MAQPLITIGGKAVSLEPRPSGSVTVNLHEDRRSVVRTAELPLPASKHSSFCPPAALPLGVAGGILLIGVLLSLVMWRSRRNHRA